MIFLALKAKGIPETKILRRKQKHPRIAQQTCIGEKKLGISDAGIQAVKNHYKTRKKCKFLAWAKSLVNFVAWSNLLFNSGSMINPWFHMLARLKENAEKMATKELFTEMHCIL